MWIALLPFIYPITCDTEYFGGIDDQHVHMIDHQVPFPNLAFLAAAPTPATPLPSAGAADP